MDLLGETYGFGAFVFYDDEFNLDRNYVLALCGLLKKRDYLWRAPLRADLLDEETALEMKKAGCVEICVGVESGSAKVLRSCLKKATPEDNTRARKICRDAGLRFKAFTVVGLPGASRKDEEATKKWLLANKPDDFDIAVNTPYPGTAQYDRPAEFGVNFNCDFSRT